MKKWLATSFCAATLFAASFTSAHAANINEEVKSNSNFQNFQIIKWDNHNGFFVKSIGKFSIHNGQINFKTFEDIINESLKEIKNYKGIQFNKIVKEVPTSKPEQEETNQEPVKQDIPKQVVEKENVPQESKPAETPVKEVPVKVTPDTKETVPNNNSANNNTTSPASNSNQQQGEASVTNPPTNTNQAFSEFEKQVVDLTNAERAKVGLKPLQIHAPLMTVARDKSEDMARNNYFSHTSPTYGSPFDQMRSAGISYRAAGENIAQGQRSPQQVVQAWMDSPGHRQNILNPSFTHIGVGFVESGYYWTQQFIQL